MAGDGSDESFKMTTLSDLEPRRKNRVIDLVSAAGVDVTDWANFSGGPARASTNPKYCYEWSFVEPGKTVVLNLWFEAMGENDGTIFQNINTRNWGGPAAGSMNRAVWGARARKIDQAIQLAYSDQLPVRVILCDGVRRDLGDPNSSASQVQRRELDPVSWAVTQYNSNTGDATLTRGAIPNLYTDQFDLRTQNDSPPDKHPVSGLAFNRDSKVRDRVRSRARGKCEFCNEPGFKMADGRVYIETHHVIPLSEGGLDIDENVVALCPNHHRESHHGGKRDSLKKTLLDHLSSLHPR
jgi:5-methylcytosine-specific restriction protein A